MLKTLPVQEAEETQEVIGRNKYRNGLEIKGDILLAVGDRDCTLSGILYKTYLGYKSIKSHLEDLVENGLLERKDSSNTYIIKGKRPKGFYRATTKGREFSRLYQSYSDKQRELNEEIVENERKREELERMLLPVKQQIS